MDKKFNPKKLEKLNNPARLEDIPPAYVWDKLKIDKCETLIDIGAGTGFFSRAFSDFMSDGVVFAADISPVMIDWMNEYIVDSSPGIKPILMDESTIPLEDSVADLVLMVNLHHELDLPETTLGEAYRLLKPEGKICIIDWKKEEMPYGPSLEIRCAVDDVKAQLETARFINVSIDDSLSKNFLIIAEKKKNREIKAHSAQILHKTPLL